MKTLALLLPLFVSLTAHADGLGWTGECKDFSARIVVKVLPWDDDGRVSVRQNGKLIYDGIAIVSTFDDKASSVSFTDADKNKMNLKVNRSETLPESVGMISLRGRRIALNCNLRLQDEQ